jgi:hypothetical protein
VARNYTLPTIKTLFAEASRCAHPDCDEPLVFRERGATTVIADIAHIRSEKRGGPRHDPDYIGDLDGPENLLLLCGKHHRPVDRHEAVYSIAELEAWKAAQRASAGDGIRLGDPDLRAYARLSDDERKVMTDIARVADRVIGACIAANQEIEDIRAAAEQERKERFYSLGPMFHVDDDGNDTRLTHEGFGLGGAWEAERNAKIQAAWDQQRPQVDAALTSLGEEVAVLRMMGGTLAEPAKDALTAAYAVASSVGSQTHVSAAAVDLEGRVRRLWQIANGEVDPTPAGS